MGSLAAFLWEFNNTGDSLNSIFKKPLSLSLSLSISPLSLWVQRSFLKPHFYALDALVEKEWRAGWPRGETGGGVGAQGWGPHTG